ncbi:hypothetical protein LB553_24230 [Mesorhizobium sp. CA8]|uniref:DUF3800 domain-containing protein n=1 Tax=Mesorhizobium sp. CA8 TaxID=2876637 RepID=UPI001CCE3005|nr:DUF3800 domain-containing protein [Mesorhizobium sp. CA8]MBZ9763969.1 hypothetical protein [Mesorhizobium sp. CA8]
MQLNAPEIRLKHVAAGEILELLNAPRLEIFLKWLIEQELFVQYSIIPLYWSIVDTIDSILKARAAAALLAVASQLKNDLYTLLRHDCDDTVDIFIRYRYPDVGPERRPAFVAELLDLLEHRRELLPQFNHMMLKGVLQIAEPLDALPYLEDETPNVLVESCARFYVQRLCLFKNSQHILGVEEIVKERIERLSFTDRDRELKHFAISHDEPGIQLSDIIVGILGKFLSFVCSSDDAGLMAARRGLGEREQRSLSLLNALLDRSVAETKAFEHYLLSLRDREAAAFFLDPSVSP